MKALGAYNSPTDYRDAYASALIPTQLDIPQTVFTPIGEVQDQRQVPACVSHSLVYLLRLYWHHRTGEWIDFSPRFLDIVSSEAWIPEDGGRVPRTALKKLATIGCCTTNLLPNDTSLSTRAYRSATITPEMYAEAAKYRIPGFIRVKTDPDSTKVAIALYGAISSLYMIGKELYTAPDGRLSNASRDINPLRTPQVVIGGHQMTPNGYTSQNGVLTNNWGDDWDRAGKADYDTGEWAPYTREQWAIADVTEDLKNFMRALPSPSDFSYSWQRNLKQGDVNEDVSFLQIALMILGYMRPVPPDNIGIYGPKTASAVSQFQRDNGIATVPGSVGPKTRAALNKRFAI